MRRNPTVKLFIKSNEQIQKLMASNGFNNTPLAKVVGVKPSYVSSIVNGKKNAGRITAFKMAKELGVEVDDIFFADNVDKSYTVQSS